jgi:hypothetical protein
MRIGSFDQVITNPAIRSKGKKTIKMPKGGQLECCNQGKGKPRRKPRNHISCSRECKRVWGNEPTPKWTPILGIRVPMDSWIFRRQLQRSKSIGLKSYLYHWKVIETLKNFLNKLSWPIWTSKTQVMVKWKVKSQINNLTTNH